MNLRQTLESDTISYNDKVETACKVLPSFLLVAWAADCAESVLHIFEQEYPQDTRPRQAIEAARSGDANAASNAASNAAHAAAHAAHASKNSKEQEELNVKLLLKQVEIYQSPLFKALQEDE